MIDRETITNQFKDLQSSICIALEESDGSSKFRSDEWQRQEGGGGLSRIIENGNTLKGRKSIIGNNDNSETNEHKDSRKNQS